MTSSRLSIELNRHHEAIRTVLTLLREGMSTRSPTPAQVVITLGRHRARMWAGFRSACPDVSDADLDVAVDEAADAFASEPDVVALFVEVDVILDAAKGGAS